MSKIKFYESNIEEAALLWLDELGYKIEDFETVSPQGDYTLRDSYYDVYLKDILIDALKRLNPTIPKSGIEDAFRMLTIPNKVSLIENNRYISKLITEGVSVSFHNKEGVIENKIVN